MEGLIRNPVMIRAAGLRRGSDRVRTLGGDLIIGLRSTALATLVERVKRYTTLVPLPGARMMDALNLAVAAALRDVPAEMKRSLAWDQAKAIHGHAAQAASAGAIVYV